MWPSKKIPEWRWGRSAGATAVGIGPPLTIMTRLTPVQRLLSRANQNFCLRAETADFDPTSTPEACELAALSVSGFTATRQHRRNGNCEVLVTAETFSLAVDVIGNGGKR